MCGIWAVFGFDQLDLPSFWSANYNIHHRGPEAWRLENDHRFKHCYLGFHRLAIIDDKSGMQPMRIRSFPHLWLLCNGEIYNCKRLATEKGDTTRFNYTTRCDVEAILHLYAEGGAQHCVSHLDGVFAFCLLDSEKNKVFVGRDTFGVRPVFRLRTDSGFLAVCSEAKGLIELRKGMNGDASIEPVAPGTIEEYDLLPSGATVFKKKTVFSKIGERPQYQTLIPWNTLSLSAEENIRTLLTEAVKKRLMSHRRIGCLLSGGLDSSLIAALLLSLAKELPYQIQTFSIGMEGSPDVMAAREVAKHIGSEHHEVIFTPEDVMKVIEKVIFHLESYDITTIRASIGMYLVSEYVKSHTDTVVLFSGEGADELAQGYIYFRDAPSAAEGDKESRRLMDDLYMFDVLRADRTTAAHGLELRVPFLDHQFTSYFLSLPPEQRVPQDGIEKHLLRRAFANTGLLPDSILWRHKEAFSDGVASRTKSLFIYIQEHVDTLISDESFHNAAKLYPHNTPQTKEAFYYREVFERYYYGLSQWIPYFWLPKWTDATDPSARYIKHYSAKDQQTTTPTISCS